MVFIRIRNPHMINIVKFLKENFFQQGDIPEGKWRIIELVCLDFLLENMIDQLYKVLVVFLVEAPRCRFNAVSQHHNCCFTGYRYRARIGKELLVDFLFAFFVQLDIIITSFSRTMMGANKIDNLFRYFVLRRSFQRQAFFRLRASSRNSCRPAAGDRHLCARRMPAHRTK